MSATAGACACARNDAVEWIRVGFEDCVYDRTDAVGFAFGMLSIACWLVAQLPQFVQNFRSGSAESLSPWFLAEWLLGDTFNLLGCLMTGDQLPSETYTAAYFMCVDVLMIFQFVYYSLRAREALAIITVDLRDPGDDRERRAKDGALRRRLLGDDGQASENSEGSDLDDDDDSEDDDDAAGEYERGVVRERWDRAAASPNAPTRRSGSAGSVTGVDRNGRVGMIAVAGATAVGVAMGLAVASASGAGDPGRGRGWGAAGTGTDSGYLWGARGRGPRGDGHAESSHPSDLPLCGSTNNPPWEVAFGRAVGYVSALFYLGSRVSQILKNKKRGSCEGLSVSMFATAAVANVLYGLAIIVRANGSPSALLESTPWLLGSLGTVALDSTILAQSRLYGDEDETATEEEAEEESILT